MISVLRLGHRVSRDPRISTHCGLASRALGADEIIYTGDLDQKMLENIEETVDRWGGPFSARFEKDPKKVIEEYKKRGYIAVHLTMYGIPIEKAKIDNTKNILVVVGGEKVPSEIYHLVDYNVAVTNQPHSEIAALSVFLNKFCKEKEFKDAKITIVPCERGKKVIED